MLTIAVMLASFSVLAQDVHIDFTADRTDGLTVGDPVMLQLAVTHPDDYRVLLPQLPEQWGDFEVRSQSVATVTTHGDGTATTSQDVQVVLFAPGDFTTPALSVTAVAPDGTTEEFSAPQLTITVDSVLVPDDTQLRDIKPQAALNPPFAWTQLAAVSGAIIAVAAAAWFVYWRFFSGRKIIGAVVDMRTPYEKAHDALAELERLDLIGQRLYKPYYSRLSEILRQYLVGTYAVNAPEMTTFEIRSALKRVSGLDAGATQKAVNILSDCDMVKFAKSEPETGAARLVLEKVRGWIDATRPVSQPDPTPQEETGV